MPEFLPRHAAVTNRVEPAGNPVSAELATLRAQSLDTPSQFFDLAQQLNFRPLQARSRNTQRAYATDWAAFVDCCHRFGYAALPASPAAVETFIEYSSEYDPAVAYKYVPAEMPRRNLRASSLTRAIAAVGAVHTWLQLPNPVSHPDVKDTLKINTRGRAHKRPKAPLTWEVIERGIAALGQDLEDLRAKALVSVAFSTMLRRSELVALQVEDFAPNEDGDDGLMWLRRSKSDQDGAGEHRYVTPAAREHLERWLRAANLRGGAVFRRLNRNGEPLEAALHPNQVARCFKQIAQRAGLDPSRIERIAGHSTRIGATHELGKVGASLPELMLAGGWKSPQMPALYLRELAVTSGAMAKWAQRVSAPNAESPTAPEDGDAL
jgi:integrase